MAFSKGNRPWNKVEFDDAQLQRMYLNRQMTAAAIAEELNINVAPVYRRLRELEITRSNSESHVGQRPGNYKGRYVETRSSYVMIHIPLDHPLACMGVYTRHNGTYVREHRLVMAEHLNRPLESWEVVHHRNGIKDDNRIENLTLLPGQAEHQALTIAHEKIKQLRMDNRRLTRELNECRAALLTVMGSADGS